MDWSYEAWASGEPYQWGENARSAKHDSHDFHVDLGCGKMKKARIGVDKFPSPGVNVIADLDHGVHTYATADEPNADVRFEWIKGKQNLARKGLPFPDSSIESMISHHVLEHVGDGLPALLDECWRVLKPGAPFRIIVPLFPSHSAVADPDHKRFFAEGTFEHLLAYSEMDFAVPYIEGAWKMLDKDLSPPPHWTQMFTVEDRREMRVTLEPVK